MSDTPTTDWNEVGPKLLGALARIVIRSTPRIGDTDEDRRRDLYHIDEIARTAIRSAEE